jgi:hypothetical protein
MLSYTLTTTSGTGKDGIGSFVAVSKQYGCGLYLKTREKDEMKPISVEVNEYNMRALIHRHPFDWRRCAQIVIIMVPSKRKPQGNRESIHEGQIGTETDAEVQVIKLTYPSILHSFIVFPSILSHSRAPRLLVGNY